MIHINQKQLDIITQIASEIVKRQTTDEIKALLAQGMKVYNEATLAAEIAVKLFLRLTGIAVDSRAVSPVDALVDQAEAHYHENYAG